MNRIQSLQSQALAQLAAQRLLNPGIASAAPNAKVLATSQAQAATAAGKTEATFSTAFKNALTAVSAAQDKASELQNQVQVGAPGASLEETMVAMQKAQVGFQTALTVRNRMVQAYSDIMNMQV